MVNHFYDEATDKTRCGEYGGELAYSISANGAVSCPSCLTVTEDDARTVHAEVRPTGLAIEPTGVVEVSIEALRALASSAGFQLVERVSPGGDW